MSARIYTAPEARALLDQTTPAPWWFDGEFGFVGEREAIVCSLDHECVVDPGREDGVLPDGELLAAAPDLAATVVHLHDELADARRVSADRMARALNAEAERDALRAQLAEASRLMRHYAAKLGELEAEVEIRNAADAKVLRIETTLDPLFILRAVDEVRVGYVEPRTLEFLGAIRNAALARIGGSR